MSLNDVKCVCQQRFNPYFHFKQGRFYGFPTCCIIWYCAFSWCPNWVFNPPVSIWRRLGVPDDLRQFVPCPYHYKRGLDLHLYNPPTEEFEND